MSTMTCNFQNDAFRGETNLGSEVILTTNLESQIFVVSNMHPAGVLDMLSWSGNPDYIWHHFKCPE